MTLTRYQVGAYGKTGYEMMKNRRCNFAICAIGEMVMHKELHHAETERDKSAFDWKRGVYLGGLMRSNESVVGTDQGVIKAFAIKRLTEKERTSLEAVKNMPGTLMGPDPNRPGRDRVPIGIEARVERGRTTIRIRWEKKAGQKNEDHQECTGEDWVHRMM